MEWLADCDFLNERFDSIGAAWADAAEYTREISPRMDAQQLRALKMVFYAAAFGALKAAPRGDAGLRSPYLFFAKRLEPRSDAARKRKEETYHVVVASDRDAEGDLKPGEAREVLSPIIAERRLARLRRDTRGRWHFPAPAILQWVSFTTRWS